jgi:hypothetical protein
VARFGPFVLLALLVACSDKERPVGQERCNDAFESPIAASWVENKNPRAPLVGTIEVETELEAAGEVRITGGDEQWTLDLGPTGIHHERMVLGLKVDTQYEALVTMTDSCGRQHSAPLQWRTPALPGDFPRVEFVGSDPSRSEPGMTLFNIREPIYLIVVDVEGQVRWYYQGDDTQSAFRVLANGNLIYVVPSQQIIEMDWFGNPVVVWYAANAPELGELSQVSVAVDVNSLHHAVREMPKGNLRRRPGRGACPLR